ncbi:putative zinc protease [bacterium HR39]|nr:putative zinc protease [bacterium HR39]
MTGLSRRTFMAATGVGLVAPGIVTAAAAAGPNPRVEEVVGRSGVRAYLLREPSTPFISVRFVFADAGAAQDPPEKAGLANMASGLLDEGAGPYDSGSFRAALEDNAIRLSFDADRDGFSGRLETLNENRDLAVELLMLALTEPRFEEEAVERIRAQILTELRRRESDPNDRAGLAWFREAFGAHPYARAVRGTPETVAAITREDLVELTRTRLARGNLHVGVAGDITPGELADLLDAAFGSLPEAPQLPPVPATTLQRAGVVVEPLPVPQSVVVFGHEGIDRHDPDFYAAYVANYILGGGGFSSRLTEEIREKRGLVYGVYSYLMDLVHCPLWMGGLATSNENVKTAIGLVARECRRMAEGDVGEKDVADAKTYLIGSFPLRFTSNDSVARMLVTMSVQKLGRDYLERRNAYIEALTPEDVRRVCARLFSRDILIAVAGQPEGLEPTRAG